MSKFAAGHPCGVFLGGVPHLYLPRRFESKGNALALDPA